MNNANFKKSDLFLWLFSCLVIVGVPALISSTAIFRYAQLLEDEHKSNLETSLKQAAVQARLKSDPEQHWMGMFDTRYFSFYRSNANKEDVKAWLKELKNDYKDEFNYIIWNTNGKISSISFKTEHDAATWQKVFNTAGANFFYRDRFEYIQKLKSDFETMRKVIGKLYISRSLKTRGIFGWTDSSFTKPLSQAYFLNSCAYMVFVDYKKFQNQSGLKKFLSDFAKDECFELGLFTMNEPEAEIWTTGTFTKQFKNFSRMQHTKHLDIYETDKHFFFSVHMSAEYRLLLAAPKKIKTVYKLAFSAIGPLIWLILLLPFLKHSFSTYVKKIPSVLSIRWKLAFLFFFASGIPLIVLALLSQENYQQQRIKLMREGQKNTIDFLLSFDQSFIGLRSRLAKNLTSFATDMSIRLHKFGINDENARYAKNEIIKKSFGEAFYIVSSNTSRLISKFGNIKLKGSLDSSRVDESASTIMLPISTNGHSDMTAANMVGKKMLSDLNDTPLPAATVSKLEILAETIMQKPFLEIFHMVLTGFNSIKKWGLVKLKSYGFAKLIKLPDSENYDYLFMAFWNILNLQKVHVTNSIASVNRNHFHIKLFAISNSDNYSFPESKELPQAIHNFAQTLRERPNENFYFLDYQNEKHLAVGFNATELDNFKLVALFPLQGIETRTRLQQSELVAFILFCMLFALALAQILFRSFLKPIDALKSGAIAIENRNLDHRIQLDSKDEFARIANIFNHVMTDFEELSVASLVQQSLFPDPEFTHGKCRIYGKSLSMSELGGDYIDFFSIDEENFAVLLGDVAGHGVGAAVIMAMAKAGIVSSRHLFKKPVELLSLLHNIILSTKSRKQRKIMTFQYLCMNIEGKGLYANAGACSPMLISAKGRQIAELSVHGPALGAFKKADFQETNIQLSTYDALVFYTDGIIETRNAKGEEIGYEGFKTILSECYSTDPKIYYERIFTRYLEHLGTNEQQDDLTLLILMFS
jgi:serine phosphatase RsbU (regulator of sigma subunit)